MSRYFIVTPDVSKNLRDQPVDENALGYCTLHYGNELKIMWEITNIEEIKE